MNHFKNLEFLWWVWLLVPLPGANYIDIADEFYKRYDVLKKNCQRLYH